MLWFGSLFNTSMAVYKFWLSPHQVSHSPLRIYWCWSPFCTHQSMHGWTVFFLLNPDIPCYLSKCMQSEFHDLIFDVQAQLHKIMCCKRKVFRETILIQWLLATKIRLEDANEVNVSNDAFVWEGSVEFWWCLEHLSDCCEVRDSLKPMRLSWQVRWPSTKGNMGYAVGQWE